MIVAAILGIAQKPVVVVIHVPKTRMTVLGAPRVIKRLEVRVRF